MKKKTQMMKTTNDEKPKMMKNCLQANHKWWKKHKWWKNHKWWKTTNDEKTVCELTTNDEKNTNDEKPQMMKNMVTK